MTISATTQGIKPGVCLSTARPAVPFTGQVIYMTDVAQSAVWDGTQWVGLDPSRDRNVVINGAMQVAQRGTSTASITTTTYNTADRFQALVGTMGTWTQSVEADAPTGSGFRNSLKMLCTTADASPSASDVVGLAQYIEGQNLQQFLKGTASAKPFILSFWVKSNVTGTYIAELNDPTNSRSVSQSFSVSVSATWEKKTITFPADTSGALPNSNANGISLTFFLGAGSNFTSGTLATTWATQVTANRAVGVTNLASATNNYWQVTGVQLEEGAVATPFEFENIGTTLAKCQRYFTKSDVVVRAVPRYADGVTLSMVNFRVSMRAAPTVTITNVTGTNNGDSQGTDGFKTYSSAAHTNNESSFSYTASAEL